MVLQSQNSQLNLNGMLTSGNEGPSSLSAWRKLIQAIMACVADIYALSNAIIPPLPLNYNIQDAAPLTGTVVAVTGTANYLALNPAGTLATLSITLPATPTNGQPLVINSSQIITALTFTGGTVQGYSGAFQFNAGQSLRLTYDTAQTKWLIA